MECKDDLENYIVKKNVYVPRDLWKGIPFIGPEKIQDITKRPEYDQLHPLFTKTSL